MRKLWWPEPLYEMKPYGVLTLGLFAALVCAARCRSNRERRP